MENTRSFGRRGNPPASSARSMRTTETVAPAARVKSSGPSVQRPVRLPEKSEFPSLDDELREWKQARKRNFEIPWRPLSLMATLCFGVGSLRVAQFREQQRTMAALCLGGGKPVCRLS